MKNKAKLDKISIKDLLLRTLVGINPDELIKKQDVIINIVMYADLAKACSSDQIDDTVDYKTTKDKIVSMIEKSQCSLIEHLCEKVAAICLEDHRIQHCSVAIDKPGALRYARSVSVCIHRYQK